MSATKVINGGTFHIMSAERADIIIGIPTIQVIFCYTSEAKLTVQKYGMACTRGIDYVCIQAIILRDKGHISVKRTYIVLSSSWRDEVNES